MKSRSNKHKDSLFRRILTCNKWNKIRRFEQEQQDREDAIESVVRPILDKYAQTLQSEHRGLDELMKLKRSLTSESLEADERLSILKLQQSNRKLLKTSRFLYQTELLNAEVESRVLAGKVALVSRAIGQQKAAAFSLLCTRARTGEESVQIQQEEETIREQRRRSSVSSASSTASFKTAASAGSRPGARHRQ